MTIVEDVLNGTITQDSCMDISITTDLIDNIKSTENAKEMHIKINNYLKFLMNSFSPEDAITGGKCLFQTIKTHVNPSEIECFSEYFNKYKNMVLGE